VSVRVSVFITTSSNAHKCVMNLKSFSSAFINLSENGLLYICAGWKISLLKLWLKLKGAPHLTGNRASWIRQLSLKLTFLNLVMTLSNI
jgi:hypothetical protein